MTKKKLKTLEEYNAEARRMFGDIFGSNEPHINGLACPECGAELFDSEPIMTLASYPPQKKIHCNNCEYNGYRVA